MTDTPLPISLSQLCPDVVKNEVIGRYNFKGQINCCFFFRGLNDIYIIEADGSKYFLRIHGQYYAGAQNRIHYEEEINIMNTLNDHNVSVATPIACKDDSYVWAIHVPEGIRFAVLFAETKHEPSNDNVKKLFNLGAMLARLHKVADGQQFVVSRSPIDFKQLITDPLAKIKPHRPVDYDFIEHTSAEAKLFIMEHLSMDKPFYGFCHGDVHGGNVHFMADKPTLFDFDCMAYSWRAYDISVYVWDVSYARDKSIGDKQFMEGNAWKAYLDGYESIRKLSDGELKTINAFAALRELWFIGLNADEVDDNFFDKRIAFYKFWLEVLSFC